MKKIASLLLVMTLLIGILVLPVSAEVPKGLTWDGKAATLEEIAKKLDYDMVDDGHYKPMYYYHAKELWSKGILKGNDGVFDLDKPLTRAQGAIMIVRLLGKEEEAKTKNLPCKFTDVPQWASYYVSYAAANGIVKGYSETKFGSDDALSANQYLTLVLRAMGYDDSKGDFSWDRAAEKALEVKIIGDSCKEQYMRSNVFMRDNVAVISWSALTAAGKDGTTLESKNTYGSSEGVEPFATMRDKLEATNAGGNDNNTDKPEPGVTTAENYAKFAVPKYEGVDSAAKMMEVTNTDQKYYLAYSDSAFKVEKYEELLDANGFTSKGVVNFNPYNVTTATGGLVTTISEGDKCPWYQKGDINVVFGKIGSAFIVRIYKGEVDDFDPNGIRRFYHAINKDE